MGKPVFSVCFAAVRNDYYKRFYDSLSKDANVDFEVVFAGDKRPPRRMPDNFRYIYTTVKPAQCIELAVRAAVGDYILPFSDDMTFSDNFLNRLYNYTLRLDMDKVLITFRYKLGGLMRDDYFIFDKDDYSSPVVGLSPVFRRDIWNELGGLDNRFVGSFPDTDMQMRFFEYGMNIFITPDCIITEEEPTDMSTLYRRTAKHGRKLLKELWNNKNGTISKTRLKPVIPFITRGIRLKTQGTRVGYGKRGRKFVWT